jgi:hypothetical protein
MPAYPRGTPKFWWIIWRVSTGEINAGRSPKSPKFEVQAILDDKARPIPEYDLGDSPEFLPDNLRNQFAGDVR